MYICLVPLRKTRSDGALWLCSFLFVAKNVLSCVLLTRLACKVLQSASSLHQNLLTGQIDFLFYNNTYVNCLLFRFKPITGNIGRVMGKRIFILMQNG
jgi:hypothetical protein